MTIRIETRASRLVYDIRTRGQNGKPLRERRNAPPGISTERALYKWAESRRRHIEQYGLAERKAVPTFAAFAPRWINEYCRANGHKPSSIFGNEMRLRLHLLPVLGTTRLDKIGEPQIQLVKLRMAGKADKTIACVLGLLATLLNTAQRWGVIEKAPVVKQPRIRQQPRAFYDSDACEQLVEGARKAGPMQLCMVLLGVDAGLRLGEMIALEQDDVDATAITVHRNEWDGGKKGGVHVGVTKGGRERRVPMTQRLATAVAGVRHLRGKRLLWQANGEPVSMHTVRSWMRRITRLAGLPVTRDVHALRHTFCSRLAMRGAPVRVIQELAGHASLRTTSGYMHLAGGSKEAGIAMLEGERAGSGRSGKADPQRG